MEEETHLCKECHKPLKGRKDKKFCNDFCRNSYNNRLNSDSNNLVRNINNTLRKNRRILEKLLSDDDEEVRKVSRTHLLSEGFDFNYFTHIYTTQKQQQYFYIYEYGYLHLAEDLLLIVKRK